MEALIKKLETTGAERLKATADQKNEYLTVVARLSREDGSLMLEAAKQLREILNE